MLELDTSALNKLLQERSLPLSMEGMEKARNMTEGSVVVLHRSVDAAGARAPSTPAQDAQEAVTAFRGQHNLHLFVSEAQAASLVSDVRL